MNSVSHVVYAIFLKLILQHFCSEGGKGHYFVRILKGIQIFFKYKGPL